jgi:hypothetical protein
MVAHARGPFNLVCLILRTVMRRWVCDAQRRTRPNSERHSIQGGATAIPIGRPNSRPPRTRFGVSKRCDREPSVRAILLGPVGSGGRGPSAGAGATTRGLCQSVCSLEICPTLRRKPNCASICRASANPRKSCSRWIGRRGGREASRSPITKTARSQKKRSGGFTSSRSRAGPSRSAKHARARNVPQVRGRDSAVRAPAGHPAVSVAPAPEATRLDQRSHPLAAPRDGTATSDLTHRRKASGNRSAKRPTADRAGRSRNAPSAACTMPTKTGATTTSISTSTTSPPAPSETTRTILKASCTPLASGVCRMKADRDLPRGPGTDVTKSSSGDQPLSPKLIFTPSDDAVAAQQFASELREVALDETPLRISPATTEIGPTEASSTRVDRLSTARNRLTKPLVAVAALAILLMPATTLVNLENARSRSSADARSERRAERSHAGRVEVRSSTLKVPTASTPRLSKPFQIAPNPGARRASTPSVVAAKPSEKAPALSITDRSITDRSRGVATSGRESADAKRAIALAPAPPPTPLAADVGRVDVAGARALPDSAVATDSHVRPPASERPPEPAASSIPPPSSTGRAEPPVAAAPDEREGIRAVLSRYELAYSDLDVNAAAQIYPKVDKKALGRAFATLDSQQVRLSECQIQIAGGASARAICNGTMMWTPKVGGGLREQPRQWQFDLRRAEEGWRIGNVSVR